MQRIYVIVCLLLLLTGCTRGLTQHEGITVIDIKERWFFSELAWSPEGRQIAVTAESREHHGVYIIDLETKTYYPVQDYDDRRLHEAGGAKWSPDGDSLILFYPARKIAASATDPFVALSPYDIVVINAETGEFLQGVWPGTYGTWGAQPDEVIVVDTGPFEQDVPIYEVNLNSGEAHEVAKITSGYASGGFDLSSNGLLAYRNRTNLEITDITTGSQVGILEMDRTITSPVWSPDGQILAYLEDASNPTSNDFQTAIYLTTPDLSCRSDPLLLGETIKSIDWSPDGKKLAFTTNEPGKIYFLDLTVGVGKELFDSYQDQCVNP